MFTLEKAPDHPFRILNLTDPQLSEEDWNSWKAHLLRGTINRLVRSVRPDLITITGDISYGGHYDAYRKFRDFIDGYGIKWAPVFGNHDNQEGAETSSAQADILLEAKNILFEKNAPALGCGNYVIRITENGEPVYALFMLDTHDRDDFTEPDGKISRRWAHLNDAQLDWYGKTAKEIGTKHAILMHIPFKTFETTFDEAWNGTFDPKDVKSREDSRSPRYWNEGFKDFCGVKYEGIGSYPVDMGEFDRIREVGLCDLVLVGHDHINDLMMKKDGVRLVYSLKTGAGCYWDSRLNGGTVIRVCRNGSHVRHLDIDPREFATESELS